MIAYKGNLPVSAISVGLAASVDSLAIEIAQLELDLAGFVPAVAAKLEVSADFPPDFTAYATAVGLHLNAAELAAQLDPTGIVSASVDASTDLGLELGLVEAKLAAALALSAPLEAGLAVGALSGWSYSGPARGFGMALEADTADGWGKTAPSSEVSAILIACEDPASWSAFGDGFNTGPGSDGLTYLGELGGWQWATGVWSLIVRIRAFIARLRAIKASIEAQLQITLGLNLPSVTALLDVGLSLDVGVMLDNLVNVQADLDVALGAIQAKIDALIDLSASLALQLSAGGLSVWSYSGAASELGAEFSAEISSGVPNGNGSAATVYGLVVASTPENMVTFSSLLAA